MQAERMWRTSTGEGVTVAVIDSGVNSSVPELRGQLVPGKDFSIQWRGANYDDDGHGTGMAMTIAAKRIGDGAWGLAPGSKILPIRNAGENSAVNMAKGIRYAADQGAKVINISQGGTPTDDIKATLQPAVDYANNKGSLIFAATGNSGDKGNSPGYPSIIPGVVGVGAVDKSLTVTKFSTYGPQVALSAPGVDIPTRCTKKLLDCMSRGTSQATAIASASAALIWSAHPSWTNNQVLRVMLQTAGKPTDGKVPSKYLGYGIVRPRKVLLDQEGDPGPADVNPLLPVRKNKEKNATPSSSPSQTPRSGHDRKITEPTQQQADQANATKPWPVIAGIGTGAGALTIGGLVIARRRKASHESRKSNWDSSSTRLE
ncbi:S8 family serine peptidase [Streptomyces sp. MST-110588]|nr:S8 family serine peptidase [Streptomyces sp. MST-110588]